MDEFSLQVEPVTGEDLSRSIRLSGSLTSANVGEVMIHLSSVFDKHDNLLDLSGITEIDFAGLKLICICHRTLPLCGKNFRLTGHTHAVIRDTILSQEYRRHTGCAKDSRCGCIWTDLCAMTEEQETLSNSAAGVLCAAAGEKVGGDRLEDYSSETK